MALDLLIKGVILGVTVAAPLGPVGMLCINRTLERGFVVGMAGGVGTAVADAIFAGFAALGLAIFAALLEMIDIPLRLFGGALVIWLGWRSLTPRAVAAGDVSSRRNLFGIAAATFALTITNPMTILFLAAVFASLGLGADSTVSGAAMVVIGVFIGSMLWWFLLNGSITLFRHKLSPRFLYWVSYVSGGILIILGAASIVSAIWTLW